MTFKENDCIGSITKKKFAELLTYAKKHGVPVYSRASENNFKEYPNLNFHGGELTGNCSDYENIRYNWITIKQFKEYCDNWGVEKEGKEK